MPNIHNISCSYILKFLKKQGFEVSHQKGSHVQLKKDDLFVTVLDHGKKILNVRTLLSILNQAGIDRKQFLK